MTTTTITATTILTTKVIAPVRIAIRLITKGRIRISDVE
jgi:hypothetical protein